MPRYKLRTLLIVLALGPPVAWITWLSGARIAIALCVYAGLAALVRALWLSDRALLYQRNWAAMSGQLLIFRFTTRDAYWLVVVTVVVLVGGLAYSRIEYQISHLRLQSKGHEQMINALADENEHLTKQISKFAKQARPDESCD